MEAQLVETAILNFINHQSLIATKASRVVYAADGAPVMEFGLRRAQGPDAGTLGARAAVIGGCIGTSNVLSAKLYALPALGTHAHSWIMSFEDELSAFRKYAELYPLNTTLLVDTYDTLRTGLPNAIKVFEELRKKGRMPEKYGIRLDSGDLAYLSKMSRKMLDKAGFTEATITASSDLDEYIIDSLNSQGAKIDSWGVGTKLITSKDCPSFGGVYKLSAIEKGNELIPRMKISENPWKMTNPGNKKIYRVYEKESGKIKADLIALEGENLTADKPLLLFDPIATWKKTYLDPNTYTLRELLVPIFLKGKCVYTSPSVMDIREYCTKEQNTLWDECRRLANPHNVYVDLTSRLYELKTRLLNNYNNSL
jgi:nicotinate phosphoribosyltransferase